MEVILTKIFENKFNINELAKEYYDIRTPFTGLTGPEISYESWQYAIKHLPLSIFLKRETTINFILHLPGDYYTQINNDNEYTFSGWRVYNGQIIKCEATQACDTCCEIHINLRDIYTDACEFISNLLLHINFMQLIDL